MAVSLGSEGICTQWKLKSGEWGAWGMNENEEEKERGEWESKHAWCGGVTAADIEVIP